MTIIPEGKKRYYRKYDINSEHIPKMKDCNSMMLRESVVRFLWVGKTFSCVKGRLSGRAGLIRSVILWPVCILLLGTASCRSAEIDVATEQRQATETSNDRVRSCC